MDISAALGSLVKMVVIGVGASLGGTLCYAIVLPGRKTGFRAGFRPDSSRESLKLGPAAGLRPAGGPILRLFRNRAGASCEASQVPWVRVASKDLGPRDRPAPRLRCLTASFGSSSKQAEIGPASFGIVVCRFVGTVPDIWGLLCPKKHVGIPLRNGSKGTVWASIQVPLRSGQGP